MPLSQRGVYKPPAVAMKKTLGSPFQRSGRAMKNASTVLRRMSSGSAIGGSGDLSTTHTGEDEISKGDEDRVIISPLPVYPHGAALGEHNNRWSEPTFGDFKVRGPRYLTSNKKVGSGPFIFPIRGVDLFLTDLCPENVGRIGGIMGGNLRDVPTFIINFRLPWGVLLFYFEIPERFLPFLFKRYDPAFGSSPVASLDKMTPGDRAVCRFLLADDDIKNGLLKIVPVVVEGPWVAKSVVGGKPAILGNKLPVNYVYQAPEGKKAAYLEADLDIASSSAARNILKVCRTATQELTLDLGFVVEGREQDELPEQMLVGARLHGLDTQNAPPLPPTNHVTLTRRSTASMTDDEE